MGSRRVGETLVRGWWEVGGKLVGSWREVVDLVRKVRAREAVTASKCVAERRTPLVSLFCLATHKSPEEPERVGLDPYPIRGFCQGLIQ